MFFNSNSTIRNNIKANWPGLLNGQKINKNKTYKVMKKFFTFAVALLALAGTAGAKTELDLSQDGGWSHTYDVATKTISFDAWGAYTIDLTGVATTDADKYVVIEFQRAAVPIGEGKLEYQDDTQGSENLTNGTSEQPFYIYWSIDKSKQLKDVYIKASDTGDIVLKEAYIATEEDLNVTKAAYANPILWSGSQSFGTSWDWGTRIDIQKSKFETAKVGDWLGFSFTQNETADDGTPVTYWQLITRDLQDRVPLQSNFEDRLDLETGEVQESMQWNDTGHTFYTFQLTEPDDINKLKTVGLQLVGYALTIKQVTLTAEKPTAGDVSSINSVTSVDKVAGNSGIYNVSGQKVNKSYKGIVVKDGKKYLQK